MSARLVVLLALPGVQLLDLAGPLEVFDAATRWLERNADPRPGYRLKVVGPQREIATATGTTLLTAPMSPLRGPIDTLVVGGAPDFSKRSFAPSITGWVRRRAARTRRVVSICTGAFVLAEAGLLDGRRATTHWLASDALRDRFPRTTVEDDAIYVADPPVYTSAGVTAGNDLALALVEQDLGHDVALAVARLLVMFLHRSGGQSQFSAALERPSAVHDPVRRVQAWILERPAEDLRVERLARLAGMSPRHFARVFCEQTGETPARFVLRIRIERARQLLERECSSVDEVAVCVGFGSAETMRRAFVRNLGIGPSAYRARFRAGSR